MKSITWKLNLNTSPDIIFDYINSDEGRSNFWAESAHEKKSIIRFRFVNGREYNSKIIEKKYPSKFVIDYFNSLVEIILEPVKNGTILTLINSNVSDEEYLEVHSGWVSVLLTLKAAIDFKVDLRNHNPKRCWDQGFADN